MERLPNNGDVELAILKCHLLIEELLTKIITRRAINPHFVEKANLTFSQKVHLARAYSKLEKETWLWGSIRKLNGTRNELAHGLSVEQIQDKCNSFIEVVENAQGKPKENLLGPTFNRFHWAAFKVFSTLAAYAHFDPTKLRIPTLLTRDTESRDAADTDKPRR